MSIVDKVEKYQQNKAQKEEEKTDESNYLIQFKKEKQNLDQNQKKQLYTLKKQFSLLKEPVILNIMKKHEFNTKIIEPELKMIQQNQQMFQTKSQTKYNQQQNKKYYHKNKNNQYNYENNYKKYEKYDQKTNYNEAKQYNKYHNQNNQNYQGKNYSNNYKTQDNQSYQKKPYYNNKQDNYYNEPYQQKHRFYTQNGHNKNNYYKPYNNNNKYQNYNKYNDYNKQYKGQYKQKNGYHKKTEHFEYIKNNNLEEVQEDPAEQQDTQNNFERISEQIDESNTYSEENTSDAQGAQKIHKVIQKLDHIFGDKMKQSYKHLQLFARTLETEQSQMKKNFDKKKYIKRGVDIKKEFIIEPDESSSHFVNHKVNVVLQNKRFESEEEKMKTAREKQLETQISEMREQMDSMQNQINFLKDQIEDLKKIKRSKKANQKQTYCMMPMKIAEKHFNFKEIKKNFSLFGLSQDEDEDEDEIEDDQLIFFRLQKNQ